MDTAVPNRNRIAVTSRTAKFFKRITFNYNYSAKNAAHY